jgi:hypothetical protein
MTAKSLRPDRSAEAPAIAAVRLLAVCRADRNGGHHNRASNVSDLLLGRRQGAAREKNRESNEDCFHGWNATPMKPNPQMWRRLPHQTEQV